MNYFKRRDFLHFLLSGAASVTVLNKFMGRGEAFSEGEAGEADSLSPPGSDSKEGESEAPKFKLGNRQPFSFALLQEKAQGLARNPYVPPVDFYANILDDVDYDAHGRIVYKPEYCLYGKKGGDFPVSFWHVARWYKNPVKIYQIHPSERLEAASQECQEIIYDRSYFSMPPDSPAHRLPKEVGFSGVRFQEAREGDLPWEQNDWCIFAGASYFRAIGELHQYGISARGLAVNVSLPGKKEEFPDFTEFYVEPRPEKNHIHLYTLLDSPSVTGAYKFILRRTHEVRMEVQAVLYFRKKIEQLGLAPLTSMHWFSETQKNLGADWRPEVHDSDGLALWTGQGERLWRPLRSPHSVVTSSFLDDRPKGFGLLQRDRNFDHYQDGVLFERRPNIWVEPLGNWGQGSVQLIEIPTNAEVMDNVVAMWVPKEIPEVGQSLSFQYRLHWNSQEPSTSDRGRCVATRLGAETRAGQLSREVPDGQLPRPSRFQHFVVEFQGPALEAILPATKPQAIVWTSRGSVHSVFTEQLPYSKGHWRARFNVTIESNDSIELRVFLRYGDDTLTETWTYEYQPEVS